MNEFLRDLKYSARSLAKQRGFTVVVVLTLALGIGINTAVFSVVDAVLFRPLPFANPDRLANLYEQEDGNSFSIASLRPEQIEVWRAQSGVLQSVETYAHRDFTLTGTAEPETIYGSALSAGFLPMLGVPPQMGRMFTREDAAVGAEPVLMLSETLWRTRFGADPQIVGRSVTLSDRRFTVVGVMPPKFKFPTSTSLFWTPLTPAPAVDGQRAERLSVLARVKDGLPIPTAQATLDALRPQLMKDRADVPWGVKIMPLDDHRVNPGPRKSLLVLLGAVGFVLLLSCANAANLLLARAATRQGEIAIRLAIGAGRGRLIRQLLVESALLAGMGGVLGVALAWVGVDALARLVPTQLTFLSVAKIEMDPRVLIFSLAVTLATGLIFGLLPAFRASRPDLQVALGGAAGKTTADRSHNHLRNALVVLEVAVSLVLLIGAGLMIRSFLALSTQKLGFEPENVIAATWSLPEHRYPTVDLQRDYNERVKELMKAAPGVESVSLAGGSPPGGGGMQFDLDVEIQGRPPIPKDKNLILPFSRVDETYFQTLRVPIVRGRGFIAEDAVDPEPLMVINESMARQFWPNEDPVGQRMRYSKEGKWRRVIGVAGDVQFGTPGSGFSRMSVYYPTSQDKGRVGQRTLLVRTIGDAEPLVASMKSRLRSIDRDQPIYRIDTLEARLSEGLSEPRFYLQLLSCFAGLTLLLVSMGIYGVMAHAVAQRTREFGIRQAIGADRRDVMTLVFRRGFALTLAGTVVGVMAATSMTKVMEAFLFGSPASDPQTYALVALLMGVVALMACWIPARRAASIDPLVALRHD